jgi:hypothetical protein
MRQAFAGLTWSRQVYHYGVARWLDGDPAGPPPPVQRLGGRNHEWRHLESSEVLAMPDTWEYPWFASWDRDFHAVKWAIIDPGFDKQKLLIVGVAGVVPAKAVLADPNRIPVRATAVSTKVLTLS